MNIRDYMKIIFSYYEDGKVNIHPIDFDSIPYRVKLAKREVHIHLLDWCKVRCCSLWGWYFDDHHAYIGFADPNEKLLFCLTNDGYI